MRWRLLTIGDNMPIMGHPHRQHVTMFILDVLRHDVIEPFPSILRMLNNAGCIGWREFWPHDFAADEILPELERLVQAGFLSVHRENPNGSGYLPVDAEGFSGAPDECESLWFALTDQGRDAWDHWDPPTSET